MSDENPLFLKYFVFKNRLFSKKIKKNTIKKLFFAKIFA